MAGKLKRNILRLLIIIGFGAIPAAIAQFFTKAPVSRDIHVRSFRYGKDPSVIRCNRGDTLRLTFSTDDTGHSFFLEEFDIDAKVSPARETVEVFKASDPTQKPVLTKELVLIAKHPGIRNYLVSKSNYRCHVWCGPMHAFEHGKLLILPNTLFIFSLGCIAAIVILWVISIFSKNKQEEGTRYHDLLEKSGFLKKIIKSRWPQVIIMLIAMSLVYVVLLTTLFGTKMSGRNLGVLLMWAIWLFLLIAVFTPFAGRIWCAVCPLPFFGDFIQRKSITTPLKGKKGKYRNKYSGLFLKWPSRLQNSWAKLIVLLSLTTFSTTLVAVPKVTGFAAIALILLPTLLSIIFEHRAFCRYLCPVSGFLGPFSRMSPIALRSKSKKVCEKCKPHFCENGSKNGWACPYGLNVSKLDGNTDCGLCFECMRSCLYGNVTIYRRPFASETGTRNISEAWLTIGIFSLALVYSVLYQGHWPVVREYINILDKKNWDLFAIYALVVWSTALIIMPGLIYLLTAAGVKLSGCKTSIKKAFLSSSGALLPLGLMLWIAFVIPMLFVNVTFIKQSFSDPFGWGWDFFGTASIPWHQFLPRTIPWIQAALVLFGLNISLRNIKQSQVKFVEGNKQLFKFILPFSVFIIATAIAMIVFYTN